VWSALERGLERYREVLARRRDALDETRRLGEQNAELRALLNQYLSSQINAELQVPPTALV
jgi:dynein regulatory complex protein 1